MSVKSLNVKILSMSLFVIIAIQFYMAVNNVAFAAISNTVTLDSFTFSCLENGESYEHNKHSYFVGSLGTPIFCGNHGLPSPIGDNLGDSAALEMYECDDEQIRKILYYGYRGPEEWEGFNAEKYNGVYDCDSSSDKYKWCGTAVTAMALTMTQQEEYTYDVAGLKSFLNYIVEMPTPPEDFIAYYMGGENGQQKLFTWLNSSKGYLKIEKVVANPEVGHNLSLKNGCYEVYSDSSLAEKYKVSTVWSKEDGTTDAISLYPGKYYVKEVMPPEGYARDFVTHEIEIKEEATTIIESSNYLQTVRLFLFKRDYSLKDQPQRNVGRLEGAVYGVYLDEDLKNKVAEIETNQSGMGRLDNLLPNIYYIKELKAPKGFTLNDEIIEINANAFSKEDVCLDYYIDCYDYPITTSFAKCYEDETGIQKGLKGASLQLLTVDGELVDEWVSEDEPHQIKYLPAGKYILREVEAPYGYVKSEDIVVEVLETSEVQYFYLENKRQNVQVSFIKDLETDPYGLLQGTFANTMFGIFDEEDNLLVEITIGKDGVGSFVGHIPEGQYYLKELQTEEGYILSEQVYDFEVTYDDSGRSLIEIIINDGKPIVNEYERCSITLDKKDKDTGEKLEGVGFTLYDSEGKKITEVFTDVNGQIVIEDLPIGEYFVKETKPKEGYLCTGEMYSVVLTMEAKDRVLSFTNDKLIVNDESSGEGSPEDNLVDQEPPEQEPPKEVMPEAEVPEVIIPEEDFNDFEEPEISIQETPKVELPEDELKPEEQPVIELEPEVKPESKPQEQSIKVPKTGDYNFNFFVIQIMLCAFALSIIFCAIKHQKIYKNNDKKL